MASHSVIFQTIFLQISASLTKPLTRWDLIDQLTPITTLMDAKIANVTENQAVIFIALFFQAEVATGIVLGHDLKMKKILPNGVRS